MSHANLPMLNSRSRSASTRLAVRRRLRLLGLYTVILVTGASCGQTQDVWRLDPTYQDAFGRLGVEGAFVLHRLGRHEYQTNDPVRAQTRFLPASTFKIFNALVAIETGVIANEHETFAWDGVERQVEAWNQDHDLASAIRVSAVWYFQELARRIGRKRMKHWIDEVGYGNGNISGQLDSFWLTGAIRISPVEQIAFLERLYTNELPFSERSMQIVKEILVLERSESWTLSGKTGWGTSDGEQVGWFVGYLERGSEVLIFANNLTIVQDQDAAARMGIAREILGIHN